MVFRVPSYYYEFACIAGSCKDSCCIGWEIVIDKDTVEKLNAIPGQEGEELRSHIQFGETTQFILDAQERCPFLNEQNLCEMILRYGKDALCQICSDHPRFYEWFGDVKEGGLGLCCEEAARIILDANDPFKIVETEIPCEDCADFDEELYICLTSARNEIFRILQNQSVSVSERICRMLDFAQIMQERTDNGIFELPKEIAEIPAEAGDIPEILEFMQTLEAIDSNWHGKLRKVSERFEVICANRERFATENPQVSAYLRNVAAYFIWRYFLKGTFDGEYLSRVKLSAVSAAVIGCLFIDRWLEYGSLSLLECAEIAKNYSKEIEYSEENLNAMLDAAYELAGMSAAGLKGVFLGEATQK